MLLNFDREQIQLYSQKNTTVLVNLYTFTYAQKPEGCGKGMPLPAINLHPA